MLIREEELNSKELMNDIGVAFMFRSRGDDVWSSHSAGVIG